MKHYTRLSATEREDISRGLAAGQSLRRIATNLARPPSTLSRELSRMRYNPNSYRATFAHEVALRRRSHRLGHKLVRHERLRRYVVEHLRLYWSPQQIADRLKLQYPTDMDMQISHESIYTYVYCLARGSLKKELVGYLRQKRSHRGPRSRVSEIRKATRIADLTSIRERPKEVEDRIIPGHWEGDLIVGANHATAMGTLVERTTRTVILVPLKAKDALSVAEAFAHELKTLPEQMKLTLTYDRGSEMARHKLFTELTNMQVYFADPHSPWQRGTNENTNGLLRQYFPKGSSFRNVSRERIKFVQDQMNSRPRKALDYKTPFEMFSKLLAEKGEAVPSELGVALED
jgi:transposase, IS30 family